MREGSTVEIKTDRSGECKWTNCEATVERIAYPDVLLTIKGTGEEVWMNRSRIKVLAF